MRRSGSLLPSITDERQNTSAALSCGRTGRYRPQLRVLDHPRARVAPGARRFTGRILRYAFRPFIERIVRAIKAASSS